MSIEGGDHSYSMDNRQDMAASEVSRWFAHTL